MSMAGGGAAQGGGSSAVIIDIMANSAQLGAALQDAEKQIAASAARMGKSIDEAMKQAERHAKDAGDRMGQAMDTIVGGTSARGGAGGGGAGGAAGGGIAGRLTQGLKGHGPLVQHVAMAFGQSIAGDINKGVDRRFDIRSSMNKGFEDAIRAIPHWSTQFGTMIADQLKPYGESIGRELAQGVLDNMYGTMREAEFEEGTFYGPLDYLADVAQDRNTRSLGRVRKIANQNLITGRQDELAALQAEQQILQMSDVRGRMVQSRMHMGLAEVQTSMGTFRTGFGTPEEASARVYDAAIKQVVALERIESIVKEIGHHARSAMRN